MQARLSHATRFYVLFVFRIGRLVVGKARTEVLLRRPANECMAKAESVKPGEACEFSIAPLCVRHRSTFCPTAVIRWSSATRAAVTAVGAIWRSPAGARMPRAIVGELSFICASRPRANSGPPVINQPCTRPNATKSNFRMQAPSFAKDRATSKSGRRICVSPEDDVELRRVTLTNHSRVRRSIELTSYAEVVLAVPGADAAHPVFSNLFVQTELVRTESAILCNRRPRSEGEKAPWLLAFDGGRRGRR